MPDETHDNVPADAAPTEELGTAGLPSASSPPRPDTPLPDRIGDYRILGKLGEGGMGVVYEAEQREPRRKVALKVVRGGQFVDESRVRMFQREADTLARLKHPNIGAIYESGSTEDGQHFFAMELVRGRTLDACMKERSRAITREEQRFRLSLFRKIADAVHYAHQRGVIHRDLKPSNIVVTEETSGEDSSTTTGTRLPEIKVLDFGLARITEGDVALATMTTEIGVIKGTLPYMSPEQARGNPEEIDVRTDVYALGVILYEMLSGQRPYDVMKTALVEAVRVICEEPPRPLGQTMSGARRIDPDLETIVGKALEKEAERRYVSAAALSEDVARYLASQPILARPASTVYQLRKFAGRNRALVGGVVATFVVLVAGIVVSTVLGLREASQRREAERARNDLQSVVEFQAGMLSETDPEQMGQRLITDLRERVAKTQKDAGGTDEEVASALASHDALMRGVNATDLALGLVDEEILVRAVAEVAEKFGDRPVIDARLRETIGETYRKLGRYERAEAQLAAALATRKRVLGDDHPDTLTSMGNLAILHWNQGRYAEAEPLILESLGTQRRVLGDEHPYTLKSMNNLAGLYHEQRHYAEAETLYVEALEILERVFGEDHPDTLRSMGNLALLYRDQGRVAEAETLYVENLETKKRVLGADHPNTLDSMNNLAILYQDQGRYAEAEPLYLETLETRKRVFGEDHPNTLDSMNNLAILYQNQGRLAEAEPLYLETLEIQKRMLGDEHPYTAVSIHNLGCLYRDIGRHEESQRRFERAQRIWEDTLGPDHPFVVENLEQWAKLLRKTGDAAGADRMETRAKAIRDAGS